MNQLVVLAGSWLGSRESEPSRKRPPQTGQRPVRLVAFAWLMLPGTGWRPYQRSFLAGRPLVAARHEDRDVADGDPERQCP
jgi:hypothetical protein